MDMTRWHWRGAGLLVAILSLAGCMTGGYGGYPAGSSYPQPYPDQSGQYGQYGNALVGTVQDIDPGYGRLLLAREGYGYGGGGQVEVAFDQRTQLYYQGRQQSVAGLERGDRIRVDATQSGGRLWARTIEVLQDVRGGQGGYYGGNELRGSVGYVDPRTRLIELDSGGYGGSHGGRTRVRYDERTQVEYQGRYYRPENLERGDLVRIQARQTGSEWLAERIWVESDARQR